MILSVISAVSPLLPIVLGFRNAPKSYIWWYAWVCLLSDLAIFLSKHYYEARYAWIANLFVVAEFLLFLLYFREKIFNRSKWLPAFIGLGLLLFVLTFKGWFIINRIGVSIFLVFYIVICVISYYRILKEQQAVHLEKSSVFWVTTGIFIYSSGTFFLFLGADALAVSSKDAATFLLAFFAPFNILKNVMLGIALSKKES